MKYKYELHLHTDIVSKCSRFDVNEIIMFYKQKGFDGVFVTDHFLNGNTTVDKSLPYEEQIKEYSKGYEKLKHLAKPYGLKVFFGVEYSFYGTDFLIYGLMPEWYIKHPEIITFPTKDALNLVKNEGALVAQAHPYREANYIDHIRLFPRNINAVEVDNANNTDFENHMALEYANNYNLLKICGSDIHSKDQTTLSVFNTNKPIESEEQFIQIVYNQDYMLSREEYYNK